MVGYSEIEGHLHPKGGREVVALGRKADQPLQGSMALSAQDLSPRPTM